MNSIFNMKVFSVYKHTNLTNGKVYIGITSQKPERRWQHGNHYKNNKHFFSAIQKYGWNGFSHEILFSNLSSSEASLLEEKLIMENNSYNPEFGYNNTFGGEHNFPTEETIKKLSESHKNQIPPNTKGSHHSEETKMKISEGISKYYKSHIKKPTLEKAVISIDKDGNICEYKSAKDAADTLGLYNGSHIIECCKGKRKSVCKLKWQYKKD